MATEVGGASMGRATQGYEVRADVLTTGEVARLASAVGRASGRSRAGARHLMGHRPVAELAGDPRLLAMAGSALGASAVPIRTAVAAGQPQECTVRRGGVIMMWPLLVHASSKSMIEAPRRVVHIEYATSLRLEPKLELEIA